MARPLVAIEAYPLPRRARAGPAGLAAVALLLGLLTVVVDGHAPPCCPEAPERVRAGAAVMTLAWLIEALAGGRLPRRVRHPLLILATAGPVALLAVSRRDDAAPLFLLLLVGRIGLTSGGRATALAVAAALAALLPVVRYEWPTLLTWGIGTISVGVSARTIAAQRALVAELRAAQSDLARQAAAAERRRIARELHDVIAHALTVTLLHISGARHVLGRDPARAAEALAEAERLGRQSLADVRRTVGLLDADGRAGGRAAPLPGADDLAGLVDGYRRAGVDVALDVTGDPSRLSAATGLGLYRIAQEALANAAKHAPGARVRVGLAVADGVRLTVRDDGAAPDAAGARIEGGGLGLAGMRERAALLGGTLTAGPRPGGGWAVECRLPPDAAGLDGAPGPRGDAEGGDAEQARRSGDAAAIRPSSHVGNDRPAGPIAGDGGGGPP